MIRVKRFSFLLAIILTLSIVTLGCSSSTSSSSDYPKKAMEFIAPGGAGGGWDLTIRTVAKVLEDNKLISVPTPVSNKPGGGGGVGLAYLQEKKGNDQIISVYSPPLLLINLTGATEFSYQDTTPIARLITDYGAFAVSKNSPYKSLTDVMEALKKDPKSVKIGGNSSAGSMDHIQFLIIAKAAGVENLKEIDYVSFQDNSGAAQVMGGHLDLLTTGLGEVSALAESGELKVLATTAETRVGKGVIAEIPTAMEQGIDASFKNWRGLFGPPEMPDYAVKYWEDVLAKMVETDDWKTASENNGWDLNYANSAEFKTFLEEQNENYKEILAEIGMLK